MTSDTASIARQQLDVALGKTRIDMKDLSPTEFDQLLQSTLWDVNLKEIRGFKTLEETLSRSPGSFIYGARKNPTEYVSVNPQVSIVQNGEDVPFTLKSQVLWMSRGVISQTIHYKRFETGEETTDWQIQKTWGPDVYIRKIEESFLALRRTLEHPRAYESLYHVYFDYEKIVHEDRMEILNISLTKIQLSNFREYFREKYSTVARELIWEIRDKTSSTVDILRSQAASLESKVTELDRLCHSI